MAENRRIYDAVAREGEELEESIGKGFWAYLGRAGQEAAKPSRRGSKPKRAGKGKAESQPGKPEAKAEGA